MSYPKSITAPFCPARSSSFSALWSFKKVALFQTRRWMTLAMALVVANLIRLSHSSRQFARLSGKWSYTKPRACKRKQK